MSDLLVAALYRFVALSDFRELQKPLLELCRAQRVHGTLLLAPEGINGTIAGADEAVHQVLEGLRRDPRLANLELKFSRAADAPFQRMKVRLKREIVTMGVEGLDPGLGVGTYVPPAEWNQLLEDPDVIVVDTRNDYEVAIGSFKGAVNPGLQSFRQFPQWLQEEIAKRENPKVAMFCTGGIRCEKSTAFLKQQGLTEVYHLRGGILKYLEEVPEEESLWEGECFVFDERVAVGPGLCAGSYELCRACRFPIGEEQKRDIAYVPGVSCPNCIEHSTPEQKARFANRMRQVELAESRGESHMKSADMDSKRES